MECSTDPNDLFNMLDIHVTTVDVVTHSSNGGEESLGGGDVICEGDGMSGAAEWRWCLNGGTSMWNCWRDVFLIGIVKLFRSGFVGVRETDTGDVGGSVFADLEESCEALLDSGVLLCRAY